MRVNIEVKRKGTKYQSYKLTIPKAVMETKGWNNYVSFDLIDEGDSLRLKPIKKEK